MRFAIGCVVLLVGMSSTHAVGKKMPARPNPGFPLRMEEGKLYHGVFAGGENQSETFDAKQMKSYQDAVEPGKKLAWVYFSHEWDGDRKFPTAACKAIAEQKAVPYLRLMLRKNPYADTKTDDAEFSFKNILAGKFDKELQAWGKAARGIDESIFAEFGAECNGDSFWWCGKKNGGKAGVDQFKRAYRHIMQQVQKGLGYANHVWWILHVDCPAENEPAWNQPQMYHPGGDIHLFAVSVYGSQEPNGRPKSFADRFGPCYAALHSAHPKTPILIAEMATARTKDDADAQWTSAALDDLARPRWKNVRGFAWWNNAFQTQAGLVDFRAQTNPRVANVLRTFLAGQNVGIVRPGGY